MARKPNSLTEAAIRKLIRAARAEGWHEVRIITPGGEAVISAGTPAAAKGAYDDEIDRLERGEL